MRLYTFLIMITLSACASLEPIELNTYNQTYSHNQFKHLIDRRYYGSVHSDGLVYTEGDVVLKHLDNLSKVVAAEPYGAGAVNIDTDMLLVSESDFSIPPALSLDMALNQFSLQQTVLIPKLELTAFNIRKEYQLLGIPDSSSSATCNIYANYRDAKLWSTKTTTFSFSNYDEKIVEMVDGCIQNIIDRIIYHEKRLSKQ